MALSRVAAVLAAVAVLLACIASSCARPPVSDSPRCPVAMTTNCSEAWDEGTCGALYQMPNTPAAGDIALCKSVGGEMCAEGLPCTFPPCPAKLVDMCVNLGLPDDCNVSYQRYPYTPNGQFLMCEWYIPVMHGEAHCEISGSISPTKWCTPASDDE